MALPSQNEPLKLADGSLVFPGGKVVNGHQEFVEVPTFHDAQRMVTATRRKVADLPEVPRTMNAVGAVLSYTLFGLDDDEIALATGFTVDQVSNIKMAEPYTQMHDAVVRTVLDSEADLVRDILSKNAKNAAHVMVDALQSGARGDRMAAAKDILDRSGHRPADVVEHRHRIDGGLVIEYVKRGDTQLPTIDMGEI